MINHHYPIKKSCSKNHQPAVLGLPSRLRNRTSLRAAEGCAASKAAVDSPRSRSERAPAPFNPRRPGVFPKKSGEFTTEIENFLGLQCLLSRSSRWIRGFHSSPVADESGTIQNPENHQRDHTGLKYP